jgi:predicted PurR-regulated permease PerM
MFTRWVSTGATCNFRAAKRIELSTLPARGDRGYCGGIPLEPAQSRPEAVDRVGRTICLAAAAFTLLFLTWELRTTLALIFLAVLLGVFFRSGAALLDRILPGGRSWGLLAFCLILVAALAGFAMWILPALNTEIDKLVSAVPAAFENVRGRLTSYTWGRWLLDSPHGPELGSSLGTDGGAWIQRTVGAVRTSIWVIGAGAFLLFTGLYLAGDPGLYRRGIEWLVPRRHRQTSADLLIAVGAVLRRWLAAQLLAMALVGTLSGLGLWALGIPLPLGNAVLTFALCFVPNFGPVASGSVPTLLALSNDGRFFDAGPANAAAVVALYVSIQAVESYLVTPLIQKRAVELPPALLITMQLVLGVLIGLIGIAIAAPLTAAVMVITRRLLVEGDVENGSPLPSEKPG